MNRYKSVVLGLTMIVFIIIGANHIGANENTSKIERIANIMNQQDIQVDEWSLYTKKSFKKLTINEVKLMTTEYSQYNWSFESSNDVFKAIGTLKNREKNFTEKLQILTTLTNNHSQSYILYEVSGKGLRTNWEELNKDFRNSALKILKEDSTIFACINGLVNGTMKVGLYQLSKDLIKNFNADIVEQLKEEDFLSISAKTTYWEDFIPTKNEVMNIQIALRSDGLGDKTTVVIGTPIITSEY